MIEDKAIGDFGECAKPGEETAGQSWRAFSATQSGSSTRLSTQVDMYSLRSKTSQEGTGLIVALELGSQKQEQGYQGRREDYDGDKGREEC